MPFDLDIITDILTREACVANFSLNSPTVITKHF